MNLSRKYCSYYCVVVLNLSLFNLHGDFLLTQLVNKQCRYEIFFVCLGFFVANNVSLTCLSV